MRIVPAGLRRQVGGRQIYDHPNAPLLRSVREFHEIADRAVSWVDAVIVGDVVTIVLTRRRLKGHQPYRGYSEPVQVVQPSHQPWESTDGRRALENRRIGESTTTWPRDRSSRLTSARRETPFPLRHWAAFGRTRHTSPGKFRPRAGMDRRTGADLARRHAAAAFSLISLTSR
jgi:hypothetical protein